MSYHSKSQQETEKEIIRVKKWISFYEEGIITAEELASLQKELTLLHKIRNANVKSVMAYNSHHYGLGSDYAEYQAEITRLGSIVTLAKLELSELEYSQSKLV